MPGPVVLREDISSGPRARACCPGGGYWTQYKHKPARLEAFQKQVVLHSFYFLISIKSLEITDTMFDIFQSAFGLEEMTPCRTRDMSGCILGGLNLSPTTKGASSGLNIRPNKARCPVMGT